MRPVVLTALGVLAMVLLAGLLLGHSGIHADAPAHEPGAPFLVHPPDDPLSDQVSPDISGSWVVWAEYTDGPPRHIFGYNLYTDTLLPIVVGNAWDTRAPKISGDLVIWGDSRNSTPEAPCLDVYGYDPVTGQERAILTGSYRIHADVDGQVVVFDTEDSGPWMYDMLTEQFVRLGAQDMHGDPRISDGLIAWRWENYTTGMYHLSSGEMRLLDTDPEVTTGVPTTNSGWVFTQTNTPPGILAYHWDTDTYLRISDSDYDQDAYLADNGTAVWVDRYVAIRAYNIGSAARCDLTPIGVGGNLNGDGDLIVWEQRVDGTTQTLVYAMVVPSLGLVGQGDLNCNDRIDWPDISAHAIHWRMSDTTYDRDGDGDTDAVDVQAVARRWGEPAPTLTLSHTPPPP